MTGALGLILMLVEGQSHWVHHLTLESQGCHRSLLGCERVLAHGSIAVLKRQVRRDSVAVVAVEPIHTGTWPRSLQQTKVVHVHYA